jgi:hypothetical protein
LHVSIRFSITLIALFSSMKLTSGAWMPRASEGLAGFVRGQLGRKAVLL